MPKTPLFYGRGEVKMVGGVLNYVFRFEPVNRVPSPSGGVVFEGSTRLGGYTPAKVGE